MAAAQARAGGRSAVRPLQRRPLSPRYALPALASRQGAASVHDGAGGRRRERWGVAPDRAVGFVGWAQPTGGGLRCAPPTLLGDSGLLTLLLAVGHDLRVAVRADLPPVRAAGQRLELLARPVVLPVVTELQGGRYAHLRLSG